MVSEVFLIGLVGVFIGFVLVIIIFCQKNRRRKGCDRQKPDIHIQGDICSSNNTKISERRKVEELNKKIFEEIYKRERSPGWYPPSDTLFELRKRSLIHSIKGYLLLVCPNIMTIKKIHKVSVSIGEKEAMFNELISFYRENNISFDSLYEIQIGEAMRLSLKGDTFEIKPINNECQHTKDNSTTDWSWNVKPFKKGKQQLTLVAAIIPTNSSISGAYYDLPVFEKIIEVKIRKRELIKDFFVENWKWLLGILFGSGLIWKIIDCIVKYKTGN